MESGHRGIEPSFLTQGDKRPLSDDCCGATKDSKRQCTGLWISNDNAQILQSDYWSFPWEASDDSFLSSLAEVYQGSYDPGWTQDLDDTASGDAFTSDSPFQVFAETESEPTPDEHHEESIPASAESAVEQPMKRIDSEWIARSSENSSLDLYNAAAQLKAEGSAILDAVNISQTEDEQLDSPPGTSGFEGSTPYEYDACFGVVYALSSIPVDKGNYETPVTLRPCKDIVKLYFEDTNKYAGLLTIPAICKLIGSCTIRLQATLVRQASKTSSSKARGSKERSASCTSSVRISVFGLMNERNSVSDLLSTSSLYLQQPSASECGTDIEYYNPHFLLRPGSSFPPLDASSMCASTGTDTITETLGEVDKGRLLRLFDSTSDCETSSKLSQIKASDRLRTSLKEHQLKALHVMAEKECGTIEDSSVPSIWELSPQRDIVAKYRHRITGEHVDHPRPVRAGVLADDMGLGKTLSLLALVCWGLDGIDSQETRGVCEVSRATLLVTPKSTIPGWLQQIESHIWPGRMQVTLYHGSGRHSMSCLSQGNDLVITTYETLRSDWSAKRALYSTKWYRVILDEAHHIRNRSSQAFNAACAIHAPRRWCSTGTPIQNSLDDYGALLSFLNIPPFQNKSNFDFWIASPFAEKTPKSLRKLKDLVRATCLRRTKRSLGEICDLPRRTEKLEKIELRKRDRKLYVFFEAKCSQLAEDLFKSKAIISGSAKCKERSLLPLLNILRLICNHGEYLLPQTALDAWRAQDYTSVGWPLLQSRGQTCSVCEIDIGELNDETSADSELSCQHSVCSMCAINVQINSPQSQFCKICLYAAPSNAHTSQPRTTVVRIPPSAKVEALIRALYAEQRADMQHASVSKPTKSVVFTYWARMLDLIENALTDHGFLIQRIDGTMTLENRSKALYNFKTNPNITIMLATIGSAGEGVDLTAANHVHLIEPHWNPMVEAQAIDRVHRFGQTCDVVVTRYITTDSIETYIRRIQEEKVQVIKRSLKGCDRSQDNIRTISVQCNLVYDSTEPF